MLADDYAVAAAAAALLLETAVLLRQYHSGQPVCSGMLYGAAS